MTQHILQPDEASGVDTYLISGSYANINFGDTQLLSIGTASISKVTVYSRALLRFDLQAIPELSTIQSATLTLFRGDGGTLVGPATLRAYRVTRDDWTEYGSTWNQYDGAHPWTVPGGDFTTIDSDEVGVVPMGGDVVFSALRQLAGDALVNRDRYLELLVIGPESGSANNFLTVRSSSDADPAKRPRLVVQYDPPVPALAVADHANNSGATATIGNVAAGVPVSVYSARFDGELGSPDWTLAGSRLGSGSLTLNLALGHYFAYAVSSSGALQTISNVVYSVVSDAADSIHSRCLEATQARLRLLGLAGLANERVLVEKVPTARTVSRVLDGLPAIILSPHRAAMPAVAGTNGLDDVYYDVLVTLLDRDNQEPTNAANLDRHLLWRQQIVRAFRNQRLPGVAEVIDTLVDPVEGPDAEAWKREYLSSSLLLRFVSRERRGL